MINLYCELFIVFFKIGLFSFGGGLAMVSVIQGEVLAHEWIPAAEYARIITISQMTPGPIAVNTATYVGARVCGPEFMPALLGSLIATLGVSLPSFVIVYFVARSLERFQTSKLVQWLLIGIRPAVIAFMITATLFFARLSFFAAADTAGLPSRSTFDPIHAALALVLLYLHYYRKLGAIWLMVIAGIVGLVL